MGHKVFLAAQVTHFAARLDECAKQCVTSPEVACNTYVVM